MWYIIENMSYVPDKREIRLERGKQGKREIQIGIEIQNININYNIKSSYILQEVSISFCSVYANHTTCRSL